MKYKKYFRKSSIKKKDVGTFFLNEIQKKNPKTFLEIGVFHGVTARNVCNLMHKNHGTGFKYIGIDIFEHDVQFKKEIVPSFEFKQRSLLSWLIKYILFLKTFILDFKGIP